ncbi:hypothetical protein CDIFMA2_38530 [Clostridioides difficile]|nr:hypothetical protein CDIFMA2_38530 [Clostridioides difficile]
MSPIEIFKALIDNRIRLGLFSYAILDTNYLGINTYFSSVE